MDEDVLTNEDIDILDEALDEWITKGLAGRFMGGVITSLLASQMPEEKHREFEAKEEERQRQFEQAKRARKHQATMLKAKLYRMAANITASEGIAHARRHQE